MLYVEKQELLHKHQGEKREEAYIILTSYFTPRRFIVTDPGFESL